MGLFSLLIFLAVGAIAGWLAGSLLRGGGFGVFGNMVIGVIGSFIGGYVFRFLGIHTDGLIGSFITALIGAGMLLFVARLFSGQGRDLR